MYMFGLQKMIRPKPDLPDTCFGHVRRGKLNSQFIVTARINFLIFTKNFKFQSLLPWTTPLAVEGMVQGQCNHILCHVVELATQIWPNSWYLSKSLATTAA